MDNCIHNISIIILEIVSNDQSNIVDVFPNIDTNLVILVQGVDFDSFISAKERVHILV